ncbi:hypothetical protein BD626DRAFT_452493 [Schizophyllum amplum]|uniref:Uncharacterized protein n=1 Tax=Schizophyllum amplum TaxID=97359 RepID=A0A550CQK1_9AGAR|nr:hypothetical protein BD626DRAFT_452493 [Auriculariopsis ampla]
MSKLSDELVQECMRFFYNHHNPSIAKNETASPTFLSPIASSESERNTASSATSYSADPHAVSVEEGLQYYAGIPSYPILIYRTGKEKWSAPKGPEAYDRLKKLLPVFDHPIAEVWNNDLGWKVVGVLDAHHIRFTTIDVVRFKTVVGYEYLEDEGKSSDGPIIGPVTIWVGVLPNTTSPTAAHNSARDVLALLAAYHLDDVDIDFRESMYIRTVGPRLHRHLDELDPLSRIVGPITSTLGLGISTMDTLYAEGTMALYLTKGDGIGTIFGLTSRHVVIPLKANNVDYVYYPNGQAKTVVLLGQRGFAELINTIKLEIGGHGITIERWRSRIAGFKRRELGLDATDVATARAYRLKTQKLVDKAEVAIAALANLLKEVNQHWADPNDRILGRVIRSPAISFGVGPQRFTEDYAIIQLDRDKLGEGFVGNKIDLGQTKLTFVEFTRKCYPHTADWRFRYPVDGLLRLEGILSDDQMRKPDMHGLANEPCLLVVKNGSASGTTIGRANGIFSIVREYLDDSHINQTSMEWAILNYGSSNLEVFSKPGDSGSIIADIRGRIGGMLTGACGNDELSDMTYATPFWWLLERIHTNGSPDVHLNVI